MNIDEIEPNIYKALGPGSESLSNKWEILDDFVCA
jgi:hypothetical protein